jgi:hypothetical protein
MIDGQLFSFGTFPLIILDLKCFFMAKTSHYQFDSNRIQAGFLLTGSVPKNQWKSVIVIFTPLHHPNS